MASVSFYIRDKKAIKKTAIFMVFFYNGKKLKLQTGESIEPKHWNIKRQKVKNSVSESQQFNLFLEKCKKDILNIYHEIKAQDELISNQILRDRFTQKLQKKKETEDFHWFVNKFITESYLNKKEGTVKRYITSYNHLKNFEAIRKKRIEFEKIDLDFYNELKTYSLLTLNHSNNTFGILIKTLKVFLNEATERGYNHNLTFRKRSFKKFNEEAENIYLTKEELSQMYNLDLSNNVRLEKVRDLFILGCFTGLRFADLTNLKDVHFVQGKYIQILTAKTEEQVIIPLHPYVKEIRKKYKKRNADGLPPSISNQKMNTYIKEIGQLAGIDQEVVLSRTRGGQRIEVTKPKYAFISSHTARRSFASNAYLADIPSISIMKITGHKTERAFLKYIKISQEDNAKKLMDHPFFNEV